MKRHLLLLITFVCAGMLSLNAITLNNVPYTIDTLAQFSPGPGATYYQLRMLRASDKLGRLDCWLMTVDTKNPYVSIEAVMGQDALVGTERPSAMAARKTTDTKIFYGGTNGDFFITAGDVGCPRGLSIVNNEFVYTPTESRRFGGVSEEMLGVIGTTAKFSGKLVLPDTTLTIKHVNYTRNENELVLYNQHNAATTKTNAYGTELLVELLPDYAWHTTATVKAKVLTKQVGVGSMPIPAGKAVLSGHGTMQTMLNTVNEGDTVTIKLTLKIDGVNTKMAQCIGGDNYALIVDSGRVEQSNFWDELHPRTAFGMTETGDTLFFLVVDGRSASMGCTTKVLGEIINYYGAWRAVNYDGGGSSCLYLRHFGEVNNGSDGSERAVGNAIYAVANVPEADNTIVAITPYNPTCSLPRYGVYSPKFLGYNRYGVLIDTDVQGVTLSCDPSVGEVMEDGGFLASGTEGGLLHATLNDSVACDIDIRLTVSAPIDVRLDSILLDSKHAYEIEVSGKVGNATMKLLPSALTWQTQEEQVIAVNETGIITGLNNGSTMLTGRLGEYVDSMLVNVEIPETHVLTWERYGAGDWTFSATAGFDPQLGILLGGTTPAKITFNYAIGRSPFLKMEKKARMYSLPDTIRWGYSSDALFTKVNIGIRPNNAQQARAISFTPDQTQIAIPVREMFGDDVAIFPLWLEYINFSVDTKTTTGSHEILLKPIELVYSEYTESALHEAAALVNGTRKVLQNGQLFLLRNGICYDALGRVREDVNARE